jgi:Spy/CpxP family protein refolding chaperone
MINTQLFHEVMLVLAVLIALALAFTAAMMMAARSVPGTGQTPRGGSRRDRPQDPQPEPDGIREQIPDDIRELVPDGIGEQIPDDIRELVPDGGRELVPH